MYTDGNKESGAGKRREKERTNDLPLFLLCRGSAKRITAEFSCEIVSVFM